MKRAVGVCQLTGKRGPFVRSHIIPLALTRPAYAGAPLLQGGIDYRPRRRWTSWYDEYLVIRAGEDILRDYDTEAIRELRRHKLIWSSWGSSKSLDCESHVRIPKTPYGLRRISGVDTHRLRLFYLSLLWRAAATKLPEFSAVMMPEEDLERLRLVLLKKCHEPLSFYPIELMQLSTRGVVHNHTGIALDKTIPPSDEEPERVVPVFRFYFDGLMAHIARQASDDGRTEKIGPMVLGHSDRLALATVTYEKSRQFTMLTQIMRDTYSRWPHARNL